MSACLPSDVICLLKHACAQKYFSSSLTQHSVAVQALTTLRTATTTLWHISRNFRSLMRCWRTLTACHRLTSRGRLMIPRVSTLLGRELLLDRDPDVPHE